MLTPDRGSRVEQKILHLLANVTADGIQPLAEVVAANLPQFRRGMTVCIVTGATTRDWVRPLASLGRRGVGAIVVLLDLDSFATAARDEPGSRAGEINAVRHALNEYGIANVLMRAGDAPERVLVTKERVRA
jgi:phosphoglycolate phosphatase-like HAD superfamily hydrolase